MNKKIARKLLKTNMEIFRVKFPNLNKQELKTLVVGFCQIPDPDLVKKKYTKKQKLELELSYAKRCKPRG